MADKEETEVVEGSTSEQKSAENTATDETTQIIETAETTIAENDDKSQQNAVKDKTKSKYCCLFVVVSLSFVHFVRMSTTFWFFYSFQSFITINIICILIVIIFAKIYFLCKFCFVYFGQMSTTFLF